MGHSSRVPGGVGIRRALRPLRSLLLLGGLVVAWWCLSAGTAQADTGGNPLQGATQALGDTVQHVVAPVQHAAAPVTKPAAAPQVRKPAVDTVRHAVQHTVRHEVREPVREAVRSTVSRTPVVRDVAKSVHVRVEPVVRGVVTPVLDETRAVVKAAIVPVVAPIVAPVVAPVLDAVPTPAPLDAAGGVPTTPLGGDSAAPLDESTRQHATGAATTHQVPAAGRPSVTLAQPDSATPRDHRVSTVPAAPLSGSQPLRSDPSTGPSSAQSGAGAASGADVCETSALLVPRTSTTTVFAPAGWPAAAPAYAPSCSPD